MSDALINKKLSDLDPGKDISKAVKKLLELLQSLSGWVENIKPIDQEQRFGNKAYRDWHAKMTEVSGSRDITLFRIFGML